MEVLITNNKQELERLEGVIQKNIGTFYEVGRALTEIRDRELYKTKNGGVYQTFEAYCKGTWDFTGRYARGLIASTRVIENIGSGTIVPATESQARPLAKLKPEQQREVWQKAVSTASDGKVTAAHVYKIVKGMTMEQEKPKEAPQPQIPTDAMHLAGIAISQLNRITANDPRRKEALRKIEIWLLKNKTGGEK